MSGESVCGVEAFGRGDCRLCNDKYVERARPNDGAVFGRASRRGAGKPVLILELLALEVVRSTPKPPNIRRYWWGAENKPT